MSYAKLVVEESHMNRPKRSFLSGLASPGARSQLDTTSINLDVVVMCISIKERKKAEGSEVKFKKKKKKEIRNKGNITESNELGMSDFICHPFLFFFLFLFGGEGLDFYFPI